MFQSLVGKLETKAHQLCYRKLLQFQSLVGKLETKLEPPLNVHVRLFQSLVGKLETYIEFRSTAPHFHRFNPL